MSDLRVGKIERLTSAATPSTITMQVRACEDCAWKDDRITALESQLAAANEKCAELAAALEAAPTEITSQHSIDDVRNCGNENDVAEANWNDGFNAAARGIQSAKKAAAPTLAAVREQARREERRRVADHIEKRASEPKWDSDVAHFAGHIVENLRRDITALEAKGADRG